MAKVSASQQKQAMPSFWDTVMDDAEAGKTLTDDDVVRYYDKWAKDGSYEKVMKFCTGIVLAAVNLMYIAL